ncbi:MAG: hypothetical protein HY719_15495 [Planctomycetes bacterium]|nr:hypothetical protein [Planctomycetota bacterium]
MRPRILNVALFLAACVLMMAGFQSAVLAQEKPVIPDGLKGFSGRLSGRVVEVQKDGLGFRLKVAKVLQVWKGNKAPKPESAVGQTLLINVPWEKGEGGKWRPVGNHVRFIRTLEPGEEVEIEVVNDEGERLHVLELSEAQRERAAAEGEEGKRETAEKPAKPEDHKEKPAAPAAKPESAKEGEPAKKAEQPPAPEPTLPEGLRGFVGNLRGKVVSIHPEGREFKLKVAKVGPLRRENKATKPSLAAGETLLISAAWQKGKGGAWVPHDAHARFIRGLKAGEEVEVAVRNDEGGRMHLMDLTPEQRERAAKAEKAPKEEPKKEPPRKKAPSEEPPARPAGGPSEK